MMDIVALNKPQKMLFALLRSSLHEQEPESSFFEKATGPDWEKCHQLAVDQGVMALAWDGILQLPSELQPPRSLKLTWAISVERYEKLYNSYCKCINELSSFYAKHNIATVQLKGVGFSTLYPVPQHREGGDIDIYTYSSNRSILSDEQANKLADDLMVQQGIEVELHSYKHSNFYYKGIPVENHKTFVNVKDIGEAVLANEILHKELNPQTVSLPGGKIQIPSPAFNSIFIAFHALQHYGSGLSLHHLFDWAVILKNYGLIIPEQMKNKPFHNGVKALTLLCNELLGCSVPVDGDNKTAVEMIGEILNPTYTLAVPAKTKIGIVLYKARRLVNRHKLRRKIFEISLAKTMATSIISHLRNPETILGRNEK